MFTAERNIQREDDKEAQHEALVHHLEEQEVVIQGLVG